MPNSSPIFTGRQDVLDKLEKIFIRQVTSRLSRRQSCLLWGMGGIGKTQICLKFVEEMSHKLVPIFPSLTLDFISCQVFTYILG